MDKLYIIDRDNKKIVISDLKEAIMKAEGVTNKTPPPNTPYEAELQKYWQHFLGELQKLAKQHPELLNEE